MATTTKSTLFLSLTFLFFSLTSASSEPDILLTFKASIKDPMNYLSSWSHTSSSHYCNWTGLTCTTSLPLSVSSLNLQTLNLSGEISSSVCSLPNLQILNLAGNLFNLAIPLHLSQCRSLETLNLSNNLIWGPIPYQISQLGSLKMLDFSGNHVEGKIPESIGALKNLRELNLANNLLSGSVPEVFGNFTELRLLDLSQNSFLDSEIPTGIGNLENLENLLLRSSGFHGSIPESFVGLLGLAILDLSQNNLTGLVPQKLGLSLANLVSFDVSQNILFGSFPNGICSNAKGLINLSLHTNLLNGSISNNSINECWNLERFQVQNNGFFGDFPNGLWSLPKIKLIRAENNGFSGEIPESISIAAQLEQVQIDNNSFTGTIPQGFGPDFRLQWGDRLRIAIGVAQGLAYLHKDYVPHILHRNVKSNNILLDVDFEPKLMDFGLDRIMGEAAFQSSLASESAFSCYLAPEHGYNKKASEQMDTYSFGVVLFELVTGRKAEQTESENSSIDVVKWVRRKINISNGALQVLDPKTSRSSQQEMLGALEIALRCTSVVPEKRPPMAEVVRALQSLDSRTGFPNVEFSASDEFSVPV
ncbi:putative leucine-rich repeat receptor-like protein kinase [Camellia lanceoleosa]|uniref:Leucine-rich repeat receptor-like protein kinase n=1 Tax=Camellia lanceoleosa TaxID=1840588 RepID=A0ACC0GDB6_9ERIC|nr:putative leucine-rich repeat receptor-like protein kinase [Camellia lanceoleosa]